MRHEWPTLPTRALPLTLLLTLAGCGGGGTRQRPAQLSAGGTAAAAAVSVPLAVGSTPLRCDVTPAPAPAGMVLIKGGTFRMGSDEMSDESPAHQVAVNSFWIDRHEVTVREFARFVDATSYRTEAERFGWSGVFDSSSGEWGRRDGANWRHPEGAGSMMAADEPVT